MLREFAAFLRRSDVLALALAVVLGTALAAAVGSLVTDVIMPPPGLLLGGADLESLYIDLSGRGHASLAAATEAGAPTIRYGRFLGTVSVFIAVAFVVFLIHRVFVKEVPPAATRECPSCGETILAIARRCPRCTSELGSLGPG